MHWFTLTLFAAFALASLDALTKKALTGYSAAELTLVRFVFTALFLSPLLLATPWPSPPPVFWWWMAGLVPLEIVAMLLYMQAIRDSPLASTLPYLAFTPVFIALTGYALLGEQVTRRGFAGIVLVVAGAYFLNLETWRGGWRPLSLILRERGARLMLGVAVLYSLTSVMSKAALQHAPQTFFVPVYFLLLGLASAVIFIAHRPRTLGVLGRRPFWHLAVGALMAATILAHFTAIQQVEVAYMIAVKRTSLLFGIVYGALLFKERGLGRHLAAGALMVAGVFLIAV